MCGGNLVQVPCSIVAHITKHHAENEFRKPPFKEDSSARNLKRVAEVWMDEYKEALYNTDRKAYDQIDHGDLSEALALKKKLKCKPFRYFVKVIAPDLAEIWPPFELPKFAFGAIYSEGNISQCVTHVGPKERDPLKLEKCIKNYTNPDETQHFELTWHKFIILHRWKTPDHERFCLDIGNQVRMSPCHFKFGNQLLRFDLVRKFLDIMYLKV